MNEPNNAGFDEEKKTRFNNLQISKTSEGKTELSNKYSEHYLLFLVKIKKK